VRGCPNAILDVSRTEPFFPNDLSPLNDRNGNGRDALLVDVLANAIANIVEIVGPARRHESIERQQCRHADE
jgi:hypothetical protein